MRLVIQGKTHTRRPAAVAARRLTKFVQPLSLDSKTVTSTDEERCRATPVGRVHGSSKPRDRM